MGKRTEDPLIEQKFSFNVSLGEILKEENSQKQKQKQEQLIHNIILNIAKMIKNIEFSTFSLGFSLPKNITKESANALRYSLCDEIKQEFDKKLVEEPAEAYFLIDFVKKSIILRLSPVFLYGKYCKFSREIAQTKHFARFSDFKAKESVEELLAQILVPKFNSMELILHGSGREDIDVLMFGKGRAFVAEIILPKKRILTKTQLLKIEKEINSKFKEKISVNSLRFSNKKELIETKNSLHKKIYSAIISCPKKPRLTLLSLNKKIKVSQRTPVRVEKRRTDMVREKEITFLKITPSKDNEKEFVLEMKTSHGTYVKEFISGDNGRSIPSLSSILGVDCNCKQLDVLEICD